MRHPQRAPRSLRAGVAVTLMAFACTGTDRPAAFPDLSGPYLGQTPPGAAPTLFAPDIVSTGMYTRDIAMTPDGNEIYFGVTVGPFAAIVEMKQVNGRWTPPTVAPFSADPRTMELEPHVSPDGQRFYFISNRRADGSPPPPERIGQWGNEDIWVMARADDGWSEPVNLGAPVNSDLPEFFPSVTTDGTLYFTRDHADTRESIIYRSRFVNGAYAEPERLPAQVNSTHQQYNAFIAPDESYLLLSVFGREDGFGGSDYYVVFRNDDDTWTGPVNLGETINRATGAEWSPALSPDGRYFFFMSTRRDTENLPASLTWDYLRGRHDAPESGNPAIYWVDAAFIERLRPEE